MQFVTLKDEHWLARQKLAGQCVSSILKHCAKLINDKIPNLSLKDLEREALQIMDEHNCSATFKDYPGPNGPFPSAICTSVNEQLVHGIVTDYVLQYGDVISIDLGATYEGAIADAAYTYIYGEPKSNEHVKLLRACQGALIAGIDAVKIGNRIGAIGYAIHNSVKDTEFGLITNYGGHGISYNKAHDQPFIANRARPDDGIRMQTGLAIAIEPMLSIGSPQNRILSDGWTVVTENIGCHFEHSIYLDKDNKTHIITDHGMVV